MTIYDSEYRKIRRNYTQYIRRNGLRGLYAPIQIPKIKSPIAISELRSEFNRVKEATSYKKKLKISAIDVADILTGKITPETIQERFYPGRKVRAKKKSSGFTSEAAPTTFSGRTGGGRRRSEEAEEAVLSPTEEDFINQPGTDE